MSELEASIRGLISTYIAGDISASELNDRLPDGWELDEADDAGATGLTLLAIGYLAGYQSGDRSERELREALEHLVTPAVYLEYEAAGELLATLAARTAQVIEESAGGDSSLAEGFEQSASQHLRTGHRTTTVLLGPPGRR